MPKIRGVRPPGALDEPNPSSHHQVDEEEDPNPIALNAVDPWGAQDEETPKALFVSTPVPQERRRGGGTLTIPLLCIGLCIIACVTLLPLADENGRLAWEREKLKADLAQLKQQAEVNDQFLQKVADDPTLAERLAQRQMKFVREGATVLNLYGAGKQEMSPFHLVAVPAPTPLPPYQPVGGFLATIVRQPRAQLYLIGAALLLIATGVILGYTPKPREDELPE